MQNDGCNYLVGTLHVGEKKFPSSSFTASLVLNTLHTEKKGGRAIVGYSESVIR